MKSMTGYASRELLHEEFQASVEIKSCNNRYLDIHFHLPGVLGALEPPLRDMIKQRVSRGRVDVTIRYKCLESSELIHVDHHMLQQYARAFRTIIKETGIDDALRLEHFTAVGEILKPVDPQQGSPHDRQIIEMTEEMMDAFEESRRTEGKATRRDIVGQLESFTRAFEQVKQRSDALEQSLQEALTERFRQLIGEEYDQQRIYAETAVMLVKYSINEEIQRTESHLSQFCSQMEGGAPVGKRLDFLCQELNREVNTIASKSTMAEINHAVVAMKDHLENIREQLRNVE